MTDIVEWLGREADDWEPETALYNAGLRSPEAAKLREAAAEITRLRAALTRIAFDDDVDSLAGDPTKWPSLIAKAGLDGKDD